MRNVIKQHDEIVLREKGKNFYKTKNKNRKLQPPIKWNIFWIVPHKKHIFDTDFLICSHIPKKVQKINKIREYDKVLREISYGNPKVWQKIYWNQMIFTSQELSTLFKNKYNNHILMKLRKPYCLWWNGIFLELLDYIWVERKIHFTNFNNIVPQIKYFVRKKHNWQDDTCVIKSLMSRPKYFFWKTIHLFVIKRFAIKWITKYEQKKPKNNEKNFK